ncbi:glycosyltransferase [Sphingobacterium sp. SRCM116780]|uniref:glycosyltransferase n=1 Tax=Sphingobacterium sp. SRCM116780 TaxID=2907623 RepID=UPI001F1ED1E4|nr:glycosyltransferase [Sphingobacterium sp. SRCM116780]UIR56303.1 glycosyltransferase [Sphingobacterium sp. SRCM116780]
MKVLLIQHMYFLNGSGGTEKICSFLANSFVNKDHQVEIATNENTTGVPVFPLDEKIRVSNIYNATIPQKELLPIINYKGKNLLLWVLYKIKKKYTKAYNFFLKKRMKGEEGLFVYNLQQRAKAWKSYIDDVSPDVIITMSIGSLLEITYNHKISIPIIDSVNGRPDYDYTNIFGGRKPFEVQLLTDSFQKLAGIQLLFDSYRTYLPKSFQGKSIVISNPVPNNTDEVVNHFASKDRFKIIHIARLDTACKQQHLAIEIFLNLAHKYVNWDFELWGTGPDLHQLEKQIAVHNIKDRIFLKGFTKTPIQKLREADIFIFPSKYEGFPLSLTEAMSVGLPTLGFKNCSGVNELIKHGENGFLAEDTEEMGRFLEKLMKDATLRDQLGRNAKKSVVEFDEEKVIEEWEQFIHEIAAAK